MRGRPSRPRGGRRGGLLSSPYMYVLGEFCVITRFVYSVGSQLVVFFRSSQLVVLLDVCSLDTKSGGLEHFVVLSP